MITGLQRISKCAKKRELYSLYINNKDNIQVREYYKKYSNVTYSSNNVKVAWKIIKKNIQEILSQDTITKIKDRL
jgi:hypothetical protein